MSSPEHDTEQFTLPTADRSDAACERMAWCLLACRGLALDTLRWAAQVRSDGRTNLQTTLEEDVQARSGPQKALT